MKVTSISITLHDLSGAPLNLTLVNELERAAERVAKYDKGLVINVAKVED
jgi:hypothetical protein